jgi:hypothetical protein
MTTPNQSVFYFPVTAEEQALLLRVREPDLADRRAELPELLDILASERLSAADLEQALQLLAASRQREDLDARFENLEARLHQRIDRGLSEIEGRLSRRLSEPPAAADPQPTAAAPVPLSVPLAVSTTAAPSPVGPPPLQEVPREANIAFRVAGDLVWGPSAAQFYIALWRWLIQHQHVQLTDLPIQGGKMRYVVAAEAIHPSGKEFTRAESPAPGFFIEVNLSRGDILRRAVRFLTEHSVDHEIIVGEAV